MPKPLLPGQWLRVVGLTVTLLLALLPARAQEIGETFTYGDLTYRVLTENTVEVAGPANGTTPIDITIPATVENEGQNYDVTAIGRYAFLNNATLESVSLPNGIIRIEPVAFCACRKLSEINIPATVTYIGGEAFGGCENLTSIVLPDNLEEIDEIAFHNTPIVTVTIPASLKQLGSHAFQNVSSIVFLGSTPPEITGWNTSLYFSKKDVNIYVPQGYKDAYAEWLPDYADRILEIKPLSNGAKAVKFVTIPEVVYSGQGFDVKVEVETESGEPYEGSFVWSVSSYWNITPDGAEAHVKASYPADGVVSVTVISSEGLPIDATAEVYCVSLEAPDYVTLYPGKAYKAEASVKNADKIGDYEIRFVKNEYSDVFDVTEDGMITAKQPGSGWCEIQLYIDGTKVCGTGTNVYIGTGLEPQYNPMPVSVGQGYRGSAVVTGSNGSVVLTQLKSISNPDVVHIDDEENWFFIMAPVEVTLTYDYTFDTGETYEVSFVVKAYESISSIKIHETDNKNEAYVGETLQLYATINDTSDKATTINWSTNNYNVATIDRYGVVTARNPGQCKITARLLNSDVSTEYDITIKALPEFVLDGIKYRAVTENTVEVAGPADGFEPTEVTIPTEVTLESENKTFKVTSIKSQAFYNSTTITSIKILGSVTSIGSDAFNRCDNLTSVELPEGLVSIGFQAFLGCSKLSSINFPEGLTSIEFGAFSGCNALASVVFPSSLQSIGGNFLRWCNNLNQIYFLGTIPPQITGDNDLYGLNQNVKIYVPAESVDAYKSWTKTYANNIVAITPVANGANSVTISMNPIVIIDSNSNREIYATVGTENEKPYEGSYEWSISGNWNIEQDEENDSKARIIGIGTANATVTVTVQKSDGTPLSATANVLPVIVKMPDELIMKLTSTPMNLEATILNVDKIDEDEATIKYSSTNDAVVKVDENGNVTALSPGESYIRAELSINGNPVSSSYCRVLVATGIESLYNPLTIELSESWIWTNQFIAFTPSNQYVRIFDNKSNSNENVIYVDTDGSFITRASGTTTLTYGYEFANDERTELTFDVKVYDKISSIQIQEANNRTTASVGENLQLNATINDTSDPASVTWRSNNNNIAQIDTYTGKVTAMNPGRCTITAQLFNKPDVIASFELTVTDASETVPVTVTVPEQVILFEGENYQLTPVFTPAVPEGYTVSYSSDRPYVATVGENGYISAVGAGVAGITVSVKDKNGNVVASATTNVAVGNDVSQLYDNVTIPVYRAMMVPLVLEPLDYLIGFMTCEAENPDIVTAYNNGSIYGNRVGETNLKMTFGLSEYSCKVKVVSEIRDIEIHTGNGTDIVPLGSPLKLFATTPDGDPVPVTWEMYSSSVASINYYTGEVTTEESGSCTIIARAVFDPELVAYYVLNVTDNPATGLTLDKSVLEMTEGETEQLTATATPANADAVIVWTSSDEAIATVGASTGEVTAVGAGTVTITATDAVTGISASCTVTVSKPSGIEGVDTAAISVRAESGRIIVKCAPADAAVEIFDIAGSRIALERGDCSVSVNAGIYVVRAAGTTIKVAVK